jgi:aconitate hydratase
VEVKMNLKNKSKKNLTLNGKKYSYYSIKALENESFKVNSLPYSVRILLENILRQEDDKIITDGNIEALMNWAPSNKSKDEVPFKPSRVILQDLTGGAAIVDLAALRYATKKLGKDPYVINPEIPVDLVIDHSVQVDYSGTKEALGLNSSIEFERNKERYEFFNWAKKSFNSFRVIPPATGIVHQVNLEYLAEVIIEKNDNDEVVLYPDTVVGTDSHTTMINALGVLGWGVGGIEAEAGMLGQPCYFSMPEVIGVRFTGSLQNGATATDLALKMTQVLREKKVVGKFVEYFGEGLKNLTLSDRSVVSNMAPEYGATCGFFPIDEEALAYLRLTGRREEKIELIKEYLKENGMFYSADNEASYTDIIDIDLSTIEPSLAGPKRPQDLVPLSHVKKEFEKAFSAPKGNKGYGLDSKELNKTAEVTYGDGTVEEISNGAVTIASITSCTNTSNPYIILSAALLAKKAVERGLKVKKYVKTSLAPGSKVVTRYVEKAGLMPYMEALGFNVVGYGCMTCVGNSGPLRPEVEKIIKEENLLVAAVVSGNRNFEGRIHPLVKAGYLAAPHLVVAYALAGNVNINLAEEPIGRDEQGNDVYLRDIMPSSEEIMECTNKAVTSEMFKEEYKSVFDSNEMWNKIDAEKKDVYDWDENSTYIANPPYFENISMDKAVIKRLDSQRVLGKFKDSITTDHISPVGSIAKDSPAGRYLMEHGVEPKDFNSYGSRRGHHEVMIRGTFSNIRLSNEIADGKEGGFTKFIPTNEITTIFDASNRYKENGTGLIILAGEDYGMGSSRDWAAKGTKLLGVNAVIAKSFERIHRSNLIMMGVLPLQFIDGQDADSLKLTGLEEYSINIDDSVKPGDIVQVVAKDLEGNVKKFNVNVRFESEIEIDYYRNNGILPMVLREKLK